MARRTKTWELSMRKVREILRLGLKCGKCYREIARSCSISHRTAGKYLSKAKLLSLTYERVEEMDDCQLRRTLGDDSPAKTDKGLSLPELEYIHAEMKKKGVTLQLL